MANTAALLSKVLSLQASINTNTLLQIVWSTKYNSNAAKVAKYAQYEEKYYEYYDNCINKSESFEQNGKTYKPTECDATQYAEDMLNCSLCEIQTCLEEYSRLDTLYETKKTGIEAILEVEKATLQQVKQETANAAKDTCLINK